ncbi:MAG: exodeoxyribonuclease VII large subunit [Ruminococcus sp.]|nr:exodeoxyribonuclease VII large subunit [Ruminococcus sp.]
MASILTVSQINRYISNKIKSDLKLSGLSVKGEISNYRQTTSGHIYFSLKDEQSLIRCVMFAGNARNLKVSLSDGTMVVVYGEIEVYERDGSYQIIVREVMPVGEGGYTKRLEELKDKLAQKGYFKTENKKAIPHSPKSIGIVASETSAALQDILNVTGRRYPLVKIYLFHAIVQGSQAAKSVSLALKAADSFGVDTIIIARGGGSNEDLSCFDSEDVADAIFNLETPCISAVGHETDFTICDMTADYRAPTPSAAAEIAVPDISELYSKIEVLRKRLSTAESFYLNKLSSKTKMLSQQCALLSPMKQYEITMNKYLSLNKRLSLAANNRFNNKTSQLTNLAARLEALSPLNVLFRGYSIVLKDGKVVNDSKCVSSDDVVDITFSNGEVKAKVL